MIELINIIIMLTEYIRAAMRKAKYEILPEDNSFYGEIPGFKGVWANAETLEVCREELQEVLEGWLILKLRDNDDDIPVLDEMDLKFKVA